MSTTIFSGRPFAEVVEEFESLDDSKNLFKGLPKRKPTLEMALREAEVPNHDIVLDNSMEFADNARENPEIAALDLSDDEAGAISCYTLEVKGENSPYKVINEGLTGSRNRATISSTRKLIYLLLSGLRKLPRFRPSVGQMFHRGIRAKVATTEKEANGHQFYANGKIVTWWGFTSTTTSLSATQNFIKGAAASSLFNIGGEDLWGYDVKLFSQFSKEEEILLEPEAKILVVGKVCLGNSLVINVTLQKFEHLVLEDIIPVGKLVQESFYNTFQGRIAQNFEIASGSDGSSVVPQGGLAGQKKNIEERWNCIWKECPNYVYDKNKYFVDVLNPRITSNIGDSPCTIIGNTPLPLNKVTSWCIKKLSMNFKKSSRYDFDIGVAPSDISQNEVDNLEKCGWYFDCYGSTLCSGPPHNYKGKKYGQGKKEDNMSTQETVLVL